MLALARAPGVGPVRAATLLDAFGTGVAAVEAGSVGAWPPLPGWSAPRRARPGARSTRPPRSSSEPSRGPPGGAPRDVRRPRLPEPVAPGRALAAGAVGARCLARSAAGAAAGRVAVVGPRRASPEACAFARELAGRGLLGGGVGGVGPGLRRRRRRPRRGGHAAARRRARGDDRRAGRRRRPRPPGGPSRPRPRAARRRRRPRRRGADRRRARRRRLPRAQPLDRGMSGAVAVVEAGPALRRPAHRRGRPRAGARGAHHAGRPWDEHAAGSLALLRDGAAPLLEARRRLAGLPAGPRRGATAPRRPPPHRRRGTGSWAAGPTTSTAWAAAAEMPCPSRSRRWRLGSSRAGPADDPTGAMARWRGRRPGRPARTGARRHHPAARRVRWRRIRPARAPGSGTVRASSNRSSAGRRCRDGRRR
jgi:hypothetical protein